MRFYALSIDFRRVNHSRQANGDKNRKNVRFSGFYFRWNFDVFHRFFLSFVCLGITAEKMAPILNQIVENEGIYGSLQLSLTKCWEDMFTNI